MATKTKKKKDQVVDLNYQPDYQRYASAKSWGGKYYLAGKIHKFMGWLEAGWTYVEPYFGAGSVLFYAPAIPGVREIICDLNPDWIAYWRAVADANSLQVLRAVAKFISDGRRAEGNNPSIFHVANLWHAAKNHKKTIPGFPWVPPHLERVISFMLLNRCSYSADMNKPGRETSRERNKMPEHASAWYTYYKEGLPMAHRRLQGVIILDSCRALEVIQEYDSAKTLFYLDPPYHPDARATKNGYYTFDMTVRDHEDLIDLLVGVNGKVLLSAYEHESYNRLLQYGFADVTLKVKAKDVAGGDKTKPKTRVEEHLWINFSEV